MEVTGASVKECERLILLVARCDQLISLTSSYFASFGIMVAYFAGAGSEFVRQAMVCCWSTFVTVL